MLKKLVLLFYCILAMGKYCIAQKSLSAGISLNTSIIRIPSNSASLNAFVKAGRSKFEAGIWSLNFFNGSNYVRFFGADLSYAHFIHGESHKLNFFICDQLFFVAKKMPMGNTSFTNNGSTVAGTETVNYMRLENNFGFGCNFKIAKWVSLQASSGVGFGLYKYERVFTASPDIKKVLQPGVSFDFKAFFFKAGIHFNIWQRREV